MTIILVAMTYWRPTGGQALGMALFTYIILNSLTFLKYIVCPWSNDPGYCLKQSKWWKLSQQDGKKYAQVPQTSAQESSAQPSRGVVTGCSQGGPQIGICNGVQNSVSRKYWKKNIGCSHPHKSELGDGTHGAGPLRVVLNSKNFADNL